MTKKPARKPPNVPDKVKDRSQKPSVADDFLTWMPIDERTRRPLDGRAPSARMIRARLLSYAKDLTSGRRSLTTAESGAVRLLVSLEWDHSKALRNQAAGGRTGDDITRLASEWRRQLSDLGLGLPGAMQGGDGAPAGAGPDQNMDLSLLTDDELDTLERLTAKANSVLVDPRPTMKIEFVSPGGGSLDLERFTEEERAVIEPALDRLATEDAAIEAKPTAATAEHNVATIVLLKAEVEYLRGQLNAHIAAAQAPVGGQQSPEQTEIAPAPEREAPQSNSAKPAPEMAVNLHPPQDGRASEYRGGDFDSFVRGN